MPLITSANIACGYHAGDPMVMDRTVRLALRYGVGIGAHPGFPDLMGFGRRAMHLRPAEVENYVLYQVGALAAFARSVGAELTHVKPHGALYHMAAHDPEIARSVARGVARAGPRLILVGLAGSAFIQAAAEGGLPAAREGFADRAYEPDGQPLVMMADHQTTGGYPKIATVVTADLPLLAQCVPGESRVRFRAVDVAEAQRAYREVMEALERWEQADRERAGL